MCFLGFGELVSLPRENSREPSSVPGSGCWLSFSSVSTAALLPPTPIPSCKLIRLFLLLAVKKESNWKSVVSMLKYLGTVDILWDGRAIRVQRYKRIIKSMWEWFLQFACSEAESTPLFLHLLEAPWIVFGVSWILPGFKWLLSSPADEVTWQLWLSTAPHSEQSFTFAESTYLCCQIRPCHSR